MEQITSWIELATVTQGGVTSQQEVPSSVAVLTDTTAGLPPDIGAYLSAAASGVCQQSEPSAIGLLPGMACSRPSVTSAWIEFNPIEPAWIICGMCMPAQVANHSELIGELNATVGFNTTLHGATQSCTLTMTPSGLGSNCPLYYGPSPRATNTSAFV